jgi:hypothetical protein
MVYLTSLSVGLSENLCFTFLNMNTNIFQREIFFKLLPELVSTGVGHFQVDTMSETNH